MDVKIKTHSSVEGYGHLESPGGEGEMKATSYVIIPLQNDES